MMAHEGRSVIKWEVTEPEWRLLAVACPPIKVVVPVTRKLQGNQKKAVPSDSDHYGSSCTRSAFPAKRRKKKRPLAGAVVSKVSPATGSTLILR